MTTNTTAPAASEQSAPVSDTAIHVASGTGSLTARDAARSVIDWRRKSAAGESEQTNSGEGASVAQAATPEPAQKSAQEADNGEPQAPPVETESHDAAVETQPPVEPPRSWSKEDKELFKALPRETQERLADRERSRDSDFSRRQQEATERAKALDTERQRVEQARGQYEQALPVLLQNMQQSYAGEFADIKTMDDVQKLAASDPIRYTQWDAAQKRMAAVQQEVAASQQRQTAEYHQALESFRAREAQKFAEKAPEFADPVQSKKLMDGAVKLLRDVGFDDQEMGALWRGENNISIHDHRLHLLLRDGVKWRDAQAAAKTKTAQAKPVPPVQRPGAAQGANAAHEATIKNLNSQLDNSRGNNALKAAAALIAARRRAG